MSNLRSKHQLRLFQENLKVSLFILSCFRHSGSNKEVVVSIFRGLLCCWNLFLLVMLAKLLARSEMDTECSYSSDTKVLWAVWYAAHSQIFKIAHHRKFIGNGIASKASRISMRSLRNESDAIECLNILPFYHGLLTVLPEFDYFASSDGFSSAFHTYRSTIIALTEKCFPSL